MSDPSTDIEKLIFSCLEAEEEGGEAARVGSVAEPLDLVSEPLSGRASG